jgi:hypothetical protein
VNWISRGAIVFGGALYLGGCSTPPCKSGPQASGRYRVTVNEPYTEQSQFTYNPSLTRHTVPDRCGGPFGAGAGAQLEFRTTGTFVKRDDDCTLVAADLTATSADAVLLGPSSDSSALLQVQQTNAYFFGAEEVETGGCRGTLAFEVIAGRAPDGLFSAPVPGQYPPAVLYRLFEPELNDAAPTCLFCDDAFVAQLEELGP